MFFLLNGCGCVVITNNNVFKSFKDLELCLAEFILAGFLCFDLISLSQHTKLNIKPAGVLVCWRYHLADACVCHLHNQSNY